MSVTDALFTTSEPSRLPSVVDGLADEVETGGMSPELDVLCLLGKDWDKAVLDSRERQAYLATDYRGIFYSNKR